MNARMIAVSLCVVMLVSAGASGMMVDVPLPVLVQQSDLIVQAKVAKAAAAEQREQIVPELSYGGQPLKPVEQLKPQAGTFRTFTVKIEKVYRDVSGKLKAGDQIELSAAAPKPPQPGQPPLFMADGPFYPSLAEGQSYVLILRSMGPGKGFFIPGYPKCVSVAGQLDDRLGKGAAELLNTDNWNWGEAKAGLQIGLLVHQPIVALGGVDRQRQRVTAVRVLMPVRNVSDKPITLTDEREVKPLSLTITTAAGKAVEGVPGLYDDLAKPVGRPKADITLAPGQIIFLSEVGLARWYTQLSATLAEGQYKVTVSYTVKPADQTPADPNVKPAEPAPWSGKVESKAVPFEVKPNPMRSRPGGPT